MGCLFVETYITLLLILQKFVTNSNALAYVVNSILSRFFLLLPVCYFCTILSNEARGKGHRIAWLCRRGKQRYTSDLFITSTLGLGCSPPRPDRLTPGKNLLPLMQGAGCIRQPVWMLTENFAHSRIRSQDSPSRSSR